MAGLKVDLCCLHMTNFIWRVSGKNSIIHFKAKYFQIGHVNGHFGRVYGSVTAGPLLEDPDVDLFIEAESLETMDAGLNLKLRSASVLDISAYPSIRFTSNGGCYRSSGKIWELKGFLEIKNRRIPIILVVYFSKLEENSKKTIMQLRLFSKINLKDIGIRLPSENGVGDEIEIDAEIQMVKTAVPVTHMKL